MRRARRAGVAGLAALALATAGCATVRPSAAPEGRPATSAPTATPTAGPAPSAGPTASPTPAVPTCTDLAASFTLKQQVGQLLMVGVTGALDDAEREALVATDAGSVILMGNSRVGVRATAEITGAIADLGAGAGVLVAVDQEGGTVQRLSGPGFDTIPPAAEQATLDADELSSRARAWGEQLRRAGVHLDLAPVADVVPAAKRRTNEPVGRLGRGYGSDPDAAAEKVAAFVSGLREADVAATLKHYPGLGEVTGNTDFTANVVDTVTTGRGAAARPFRAGVRAGAGAVMLSTAYYPRIDADHPAAFSPAVVDLVRTELGFGGVVISDDLGVARAVADVPARDRATRFVRAGGDLAITVDPARAAAMASGLLAEAGDDPDLAARVAESTGRVLALKAGLGLASCVAVEG